MNTSSNSSKHYLPKTLQEREAFAQMALVRDIDKARDKYDLIMVDRSFIPVGSRLTECYETDTEWIIIGDPGEKVDVDGNPVHDCDEMGCCTFSHVVARFPKP